MDAIEKLARELLAAEWESIGVDHIGWSATESRQVEEASIRAIIAALTPPEGWVLMPRVLTEEMLQAGYPADDAQVGYEAMIAARPEVKP